MYGMCSLFLLVCFLCQRHFASIVHWEQVRGDGGGSMPRNLLQHKTAAPRLLPFTACIHHADTACWMLCPPCTSVCVCVCERPAAASSLTAGPRTPTSLHPAAAAHTHALFPASPPPP